MGFEGLSRDLKTAGMDVDAQGLRVTAGRQEGSVIFEAVGRAGQRNRYIFFRSIVPEAAERKGN
jgi:hypothetical protein